MRTVLLSLSICLAVAAGFGCGADKCRTSGDACAVTTDCCDGLACFDGVCGEPSAQKPTCPAEAPVDCGSVLPDMCCPSDTPFCCAKDQLCHVDAADCNGPPSCSGKACASSSSFDCCAGFTCARFGHTCHTAKNLDLGDACIADSQCASKSCTAYCSKPCASTAECGTANQCLQTLAGFRCIPFCSTSADCTVFGPNITCQKSTDPSGLNLNGCFAK